MSLIQKLTPLNLLEEKAKFMADQSYNPQFIYTEPVSPQKLIKYGSPKPAYVDLAQEIVTKAYLHRNERELEMLQGPQLLQSEVTKKVKAFLKLHLLEKKYKIVWSGSFVSRTSITADTIKLRSPADFRREGLLGMLYHEIGTHALRRFNDEQQPWHKQKPKYGFSDYLITEEGLATIHGLIPHTYKSAHVSALRYLAVAYAQQCSWVELWKLLGKYIQDEERRWVIVLRQKRGLTDTGRPTGFTKDLVYFQGMIEVWQWLSKKNFDVSDLYYGKLAMADVEKARRINPKFHLQLPSFFEIDHEKYRAQVEMIGKENMLENL